MTHNVFYGWLVLATYLVQSAPVSIRADTNKIASLIFASSSNFFTLSRHEESLQLHNNEAEILGIDADRNELNITSDLKIMNMWLQNMLNDDFFMVNLQTFEQGAEGWTNARLSTCGISADIFLGGRCKYSYHSSERTYKALPPHARIRITGRIHFIGNWAGESVVLLIDDKYASGYSHHWCPSIFQSKCQQYNVNECGSLEGDKLSTFFNIELTHRANSVKIGVQSTLPNSTDPCSTSWGIDDVALYVR
eukprot:Gregarina_sp_Poly_1__3998@NODE_2206_length_2490_cov_107_981428_g1421_i0_p1_GENE_NODE_2206_length_2490_cov_107_981428_g1421_i0NODE_2206_length_2490_cov_107_981428_g1421_i0_p1_ORF_typecomplete_len250_score15_89_NODE_2206_length_2490_cov_107_981428_g1421_i06211370